MGWDSLAGETKTAGAEIGWVNLAGAVVEEEVGVALLVVEVVTLVATDGAAVYALLELDFMSCCPPFLSNITKQKKLFAQTAIVGVVTLVVSVVVVAAEVAMVAVLIGGAGGGGVGGRGVTASEITLR